MIEEIEIVEYKCFKNLKLDGLSQINVITGGNNVGKTALLEAIFIENEVMMTHTDIPLNLLLHIAKNRDVYQERLEKYLKYFKFKSYFHKIEYKDRYSLDKKEKERLKEFNQDYNGFFIGLEKEERLTPFANIDYNKYESYSNYINSSKPTNQRLINLYSPIQSFGKQDIFLDYLKVLDDIDRIEPYYIAGKLILRVSLNNPINHLLSSELGEGINRYIEILASLLSNSGGIVFIDEIENGIHYSKLKNIWKAIIEIVKKENIQLFVTTHDKDTIEALNKASEEMKYEDITSIELFKKDGVIHPIIMNYENFSYGINMGEDVR